MDYSNDIESHVNKRRYIAVLTPSWLSGLVCIILGLGVTLGVVIAFDFNASGLQHQLIGFEHTPSSQPALTLPGQTAPMPAASSLQNTWPLIAFWAVVGLIVYFIAEAIVKAVLEAREFSSELSYVHARRDLLIKTAWQNVALRLAIGFVWLVFIDLSLKRIIPLAISSAHKAAIGGFVSSLWHGFACFVLIALCLHINIVFLRLMLRRTRVISSVDYSDV
ncbi:MAG TPA: hypothetical protein VL989_01045 [Candidatus Sulfotelmatobacter sp.]|nr:hypothetical protein [Candidatus Sulfotelmatobacter sp.]